MNQIDVDEIAEVNYPDDAPETAAVTFKDGRTETYSASDHREIFEVLNHWTPPTA